MWRQIRQPSTGTHVSHARSECLYVDRDTKACVSRLLKISCLQLLSDMLCLLPYCSTRLLFISDFFFRLWTHCLLHSKISCIISLLSGLISYALFISVANYKLQLPFVSLRALKHILKPETRSFFIRIKIFLCKRANCMFSITYNSNFSQIRSR